MAIVSHRTRSYMMNESAIIGAFDALIEDMVSTKDKIEQFLLEYESEESIQQFIDSHLGPLEKISAMFESLADESIFNKNPEAPSLDETVKTNIRDHCIKAINNIRKEYESCKSKDIGEK